MVKDRNVSVKINIFHFFGREKIFASARLKRSHLLAYRREEEEENTTTGTTLLLLSTRRDDEHWHVALFVGAREGGDSCGS